MKTFEYYLLSESGYHGTYERKEPGCFVKTGTVADLLHDSGMLWGYDFDKVIPSLATLNDILSDGEYPRLAEWEPFTLEQEEYDEMVQALLALPLARPYRIE